jgi:DNA-binding response OmpR family regulator
VRLAPGLPFIILSANSNVVDKVHLLELGAADYVRVPFSPRELVARLRAQIRRVERISLDTPYVFRDVIVDFSKTETTR